MSKKILGYEVQAARGNDWVAVSKHADRDAAFTALNRQNDGPGSARTRVIENFYDTETRSFESTLIQAPEPPPAVAKSVASAAPLRVFASSRGGTSILRILITLMLIAIGTLAAIMGVSYLFERGVIG